MPKLASLMLPLQAVIRLARVSSQGLTGEEPASKLKCPFTQHLVDLGPGSLLIKGQHRFLSVWFLIGLLTRWQPAYSDMVRQRQMKDRGRETGRKEEKGKRGGRDREMERRS